VVPSFLPVHVWMGEIVFQRAARLFGWAAGRLPRGNTDALAAPALAAGFAGFSCSRRNCRSGTAPAWLAVCLLLLITAGAVIGSLRFEKRFSGAATSLPGGRMNGLLPSFSILELPREAGHLQRQLRTMPASKVAPPMGEGLAHAGCPAWHPPGLTSRTNRNSRASLPHLRQALPAIASRGNELTAPAADLQGARCAPAGKMPGCPWCWRGASCLKFWERLWGGWALAPAAAVGPLFAAAGLWLPGPWPLRRCCSWRCGFGWPLAAGFFALRQPAAAGALWLVPLLSGPVLARHLPLGHGGGGDGVAGEPGWGVGPGPWPSWSARSPN